MVKTENGNSILKLFISKFADTDFFQDIVNVSLFPSDFSGTIGDNNGTIDDHLKKFLNDLNGTVGRIGLENRKIIDSHINTIKTILTIRSAGKGLITYDNVFQHISSQNIAVKKLIQSAIDLQLNDNNKFRLKIDNILNKIDYFYDINLAVSGMTKINNFVDSVNNPDISIIEAVTKYKDMGLEIYSDLSNLQSLAKEEASTDYYMISDEESAENITTDVVDYISSGYSFFKSGINIIDNNLDGIESSSVYMINAPSNSGKSVLLCNLLNNLVSENVDDYESNDACLFITLEDDITKLLRRLICIFGNYEFASVKSLYTKSNDIFNAEKKKSRKTGIEPELDLMKKKVEDIVKILINNAIVAKTKNNVNVILKHSAEGSYCAGDIARYIEKLKAQGINIKSVIIDYLDVMAPTITQSYFKEHMVLGLYGCFNS